MFVELWIKYITIIRTVNWDRKPVVGHNVQSAGTSTEVIIIIHKFVYFIVFLSAISYKLQFNAVYLSQISIEFGIAWQRERHISRRWHERLQFGE